MLEFQKASGRLCTQVVWQRGCRRPPQGLVIKTQSLLEKSSLGCIRTTHSHGNSGPIWQNTATKSRTKCFFPCGQNAQKNQLMLVNKNSTYLLQVWSLRSNGILPVRVQAHFQSLSMAVTWTSIFLLNPFFYCAEYIICYISVIILFPSILSLPTSGCYGSLKSLGSPSGPAPNLSVLDQLWPLPLSFYLFCTYWDPNTQIHSQQKVKNVFKSYQRSPASMTKISVSLKIHLLKNRVLLLLEITQ